MCALDFTFLTPGGGSVNAEAWSWVERIECRAITLYLKVKTTVLSKSFFLETLQRITFICTSEATLTFFTMKYFRHTQKSG